MKFCSECGKRVDRRLRRRAIGKPPNVRFYILCEDCSWKYDGPHIVNLLRRNKKKKEDEKAGKIRLLERVIEWNEEFKDRYPNSSPVEAFDNLLKKSLIAIYYDDPLVVMAIDSLDFSQVNYKFKLELFARIDIDTFDRVDSFLRGEDYAAYKNAIESASIACTKELGEMMSFVYSQKEGGVN